MRRLILAIKLWAVFASISAAQGSRPSILALSANQTVKEGSRVTLTVLSASASPQSFQWRLNGTKISGATSNSYTIPNASAADSGKYSVEVANSTGVSSSFNPKSVACGSDHSVFVKRDGTVWTMGRNNFGQLGDSTTTDRKLPVQIGQGVASVSSYSFGTHFIKKDGTLWGSGLNTLGQLGDGTNNERHAPVLAANNVASVASGTYQTIIVKVDGTSVGVGSNWVGEATTNSDTDGAVNAGAGAGHSLIVRRDGALLGFGDNSSGQLGLGTLHNFTKPALMASNVVAAVGGASHSCYLTSDETLWAMGNNSQGQLGNGSNVSSNTPQIVASNVRQVAAGGNHTLFLKTGGALWITGANRTGQLGDGTTIARNTPIQIATDVVAIAAGSEHSLFVTSDGKLWGMGRNDFGQLGDGTTTNRHSPVLIATDALTDQTDITISVSQVGALSISADPASLSLQDLQSCYLPVVTATYDDGTPFTAPIVLSVVDSSIASIDTPLITAQKIGSTSIRATLLGRFTKDIPLTVSAPSVQAQVSSIRVTNVPSTLAISQSVDLNFEVVYADGTRTTNPAGITMSALAGRVSCSGRTIIGARSGVADVIANYGGNRTSFSFVVKAIEEVPVIDPYLAAPAANSSLVVPVVVINYYPTNNGVDIDTQRAPSFGSLAPITITGLKSRTVDLLRLTKFGIEEGSKFRGFARDTQPYVGVKVVKYFNVYELKKGRKSASGNEYEPDYADLFQKIGMKDLVELSGVKEVWFSLRPLSLGYPVVTSERLSPENFLNLPESNMSSPLTGDISNSSRSNDDLPIYSKTYVVYGQNLHRSHAENIHNRGHQLESELVFLDKSPSSPAGSRLFWDKFVGNNNGRSYPTGRSGNTHFPPNGQSDYDYGNAQSVNSDIEAWRPDGGVLKSINFRRWVDIRYSIPPVSTFVFDENDAHFKWLIFWFQAIPGLANGITCGGGSLSNWWDLFYNWDEAITSGNTLWDSRISGSPQIIAAPSSLSATINTVATFTVAASGSPLPSYQWFKNGVTIAGATGPTFTINPVNSSSAGYYNVVVSNSAGSLTSKAAALTIPAAATAPTITSQSSNQAVTTGAPASFTVSASGYAPLTYQWFFNGVAISGATSSTCSLPSASAGNAGSYTAVVTNSAGSVSSDAVVLTVAAPVTIPPAPVISSSLAGTCQVGVAFTYAITASNTPTSFNATGLPPSLAVNTSNGVISGTPTATGTYNVSIAAANTAGTDSKILVLTVVAPVPVITSAATTSAQVGVAFSYTITATNGPVSFNASGLPPGLTVNTSTGVISGTPAAPGQYGVSVSAASTTGSGTAVITINVAPRAPVVSSSLTSSAFVGRPYSYAIIASNTPTSFNATGLPSGLAVNQATGAITGAPNAAGTYNVTITAANTGGTDSKTLVLTVTVPPAPVISGSLATTAKLGFPYTYTITGSNTPTSYNAAGLPPGLSVNTATGAITGAPSGLGTYLVNITAANAGGGATATLSISVTRAPQDSLLSGNQSDLLLENIATGERVIWQMNGATIAGSAALPTFTAGWHFAGTGDFNSDGRSDIVLQNTISGDRVVWLMNGTTISSSAAFPTLPLVWQIACVGDLNSDGKPDVILQNSATNERVAWLMNGTAIASSYNLPSLPAAWLFCGIMDFNGDSRPDLLIQNTDTGERVIWILNAQLGITQSFNLPTFYAGWRFAGVGRFTPDNLPNIVLQNTLNGERALWSINTSGQIAASTALPNLPVSWSFAGPALNRAKTPAKADFNRDHRSDILLENTASGERVIWLMDGTGIAASANLPTFTEGWRFAGSADFNADGMNDIVLQNRTTGERVIWLMNFTSIGGSVALPTLPTAWDFAAIGDINRDLQPDIVLQHQTSGERLVWLMDRTSISGSINLPTLPLSWQIAAAGSFTTDPRTSLLLENTASGERTFWVLDPNGAIQRSVGLPSFLGGWRFAGTGDFFSSSRPHLLLQNLLSGERAIWRMDTTSLSSSSALPSLPVTWVIKN